MPFDISAIREFSASHQLRMPDGSLEPLHGHNWKVQVRVSADQLDPTGLVMDFHQLEHLMDQVIGGLHHRHLNEVEAFATMNPSAENVALHVARSLRLPGSVRLASVEVWETGQNSAVYRA